jgi:Na+-transporting NADH:ubiquinone oxidoreductase subunit NqrE
MKFRGVSKFPIRLNGASQYPESFTTSEYLDSSVIAAQVDRNSNAYDEFLFAENHVTQMPYESSLESRMLLAATRVGTLSRKEMLSFEAEVLENRKALGRLQIKVDGLEAKVQKVDAMIELEKDILSGTSLGHANLVWQDALPVFTSRTNALLQILRPTFLLALIGLADLSVIFLSISDFFKDQPTALIMTLPAIGIQLFFPHLLGEQLSRVNRGEILTTTRRIWTLLIGMSWLVFIVALTRIRTDLTWRSLNADIDGGGLDYSVYILLLIINIMMLVGLGISVLAMASRSNPHSRNYLRVSFRREYLLDKLNRRLRALENSKLKLEFSEMRLQAARDNYLDAMKEIPMRLIEAGRDVYRRALVNEFGQVEFTNRYLNSNRNGKETR